MQPVSTQDVWQQAGSMRRSLQQPGFAGEQVDTVPLRSQKLVLQPQPTGIGMNISYSNPHRNDYQMQPGAMQLQQPPTGLHGALPWGPAPPVSAPLQFQNSTGSSMLSTHSAYQLDEAAAEMQGEGDLCTFLNEDRAAAAARPRDVHPKGGRYQPKASTAAPQQLQQAISLPQHAQPATLQELLAAHAQHAPAAAPQDEHGMANMQQEPAGGTMLEGQDSADGQDLLMLVAQAAEMADAEQAAQQAQPQQADAPQQPAADSKAQDALLAACAEALGQVLQSNQAAGPVLSPMQGHWHAHAGAAPASGTPDEPMHGLQPASAAHASTDDDDAAARDAHMRHAIAAALAAEESRGADAAGGLASRNSRSQVAQQAVGPSSRPKRAAAREADIRRQVYLQEEAMRKRPARRGSSQHSVVDERMASQHAAQLQQLREKASASLPPLPHKKRRSSSPAVRKHGSDVMGMLQPSPATSGNNSIAPPADGGAADSSKSGQAASEAVLKRKRGAGSNDAAASKPSAPPQETVAAASGQRTTAATAAAEPTHSMTKAASAPPSSPQAAAARRRKQTQATPQAAVSSNPAAVNTGPSAATPAAGKATAVADEQAGASKSGGSNKAATEAPTAQAGPDPTSDADADAMQRAAADRPPRRVAAAHASLQIAAGSGGSKAVASQDAAPASGGRTAGPQAQRSKHVAAAAGASKPRPAAASKGAAALAAKSGPSAAPKARVRPAKRAAAKAGSSDGSGTDYEQSSSSGYSSSDEDDAEYRAAKRRGSVSKALQQSGSSKAADGVAEPKKAGPKGGRPLGAANKREMQPRKKNADGVAAYGCRSQRFRGVYMCQRVTVRWRTQFSYGRKVLNVGSYQTEEDAARAWNAAAMHFRGGDCWVNPVEPVLPEDEGLAIAASLPQPEGGSLLPASMKQSRKAK